MMIKAYKARKDGRRDGVKGGLYNQTMMPGKWNENGRREGGMCRDARNVGLSPQFCAGPTW